MLHPGTKVKVKSFMDIEKTLDKNNYCGDTWFAPPMKTFCEREFKIKAYSEEYSTYILDDIPWNWREKWFDVINESTNYLNDGSIEQRSLCLALVRQTMSGNTPDVDYLRHYRNQAFPSEIHNGFSYTDYPQDKWTNS